MHLTYSSNTLLINKNRLCLQRRFSFTQSAVDFPRVFTYEKTRQKTTALLGQTKRRILRFAFAFLEYYFNSGKSIFSTFCVTRRDCPAYGKMCIIIIGLKLASITPQDCKLGSAGLVKSGMIKSTPHTAAPMALVIPTAKAL